MRLTSKAQQIHELIAPAVQAAGMVLWGLEFSPQGKRSLLRVYIESPEAKPELGVESDTRVTVEDCVRVNHQVSNVLDVHDPIAGEFVLEVSSPGWERRFFSIEQMQPFVGQLVALRLIHALHGQRKFQGKLVSVTEGEIQLADKDTGVVTGVSPDNVDKANLIVP